MKKQDKSGMRLVSDVRHNVPAVGQTRREYIENYRKLTIAERRRERAAKYFTLGCIIAGVGFACMLWIMIEIGAPR